MLLECRDELKFTPRALILLIGTQLVEIKELDIFLCKVCVCTCAGVYIYM